MRMVFVLALVAALIEPGAAQGTDASVVGLWLGEARTQGGLGNWIEFRADGTLEAGFGALVGGLLDDTYRFDGTTLMLHVFSGKATAAGVRSSSRSARPCASRAIMRWSNFNRQKICPLRRRIRHRSKRCWSASVSQ